MHACGYSVPNKCSSMHFTHFPMWRALSGTTFVALSTYWSSRTDRSRWLVEPRRVKGQAQALGDWPVLSPIKRNSALCVKVLHRQSLPNSAGACHPPHPRWPVAAPGRSPQARGVAPACGEHRTLARPRPGQALQPASIPSSSSDGAGPGTLKFVLKAAQARGAHMRLSTQATEATNPSVITGG